MQGQCFSSPFSSFFPGGWVGSEALTHQQVPCSPFISSPFSQLPLIPLLCLFTVHLPCLSFTSLCFFPLQILGPPPRFPFWVCNLCPLFSCNPLVLCLSPIPPLVSASHHFAYNHCPIMPSPALFLPPSIPAFHQLFPSFLRSLLTFTLSPFSHSHLLPSLHLFLCLLITLCSPCFHRSTS